MYFDKLDDVVDLIFDDFFATTIKSDKNFVEFQKEQNFVKFQKEINNMIDNYVKTLPVATIENISKNSDVINNIYEVIIKYLFMYIFLFIGVTSNTKPDIYINNIIEFSKNQAEYQTKLFNFFNSDSNHTVIKLYYICKNVIFLTSQTKFRIDGIKNEPFSDETVTFVSTLGEDFVKNTLGSTTGDKTIQIHNIIKIMIAVMMYKEKDKKTLQSLIEQSNMAEGDYIFIDIIETTDNTVNFGAIESLLSARELKRGTAYDIWKFIENVSQELTQFMSADEKINMMINAGIIVPILDDFLLYHKNTEKYDKQSGAEGKKKDMTKLKYIVGKIDETAELYSETVKNNPKMKDNIMKNFYGNMMWRKAILRNNYEETSILNKYRNMGSSNEIEQIDDLLYYRRYTFVNFKEFEKYGFTNYFTKTVTSVRAVNFVTDGEFKQTNNYRLQLRVGAKNSFGNIVGFIVPTNTQPIQCVTVSDVVDVRNLAKSDGSAFDVFLHFLKRSKIKNEPHKASVFWLFDLDKDKVKLSSTGEQNSMQDIVKNIVGELFDKFMQHVYYEIVEKIDKYPDMTLRQLNLTIKQIERALDISIDARVRNELEKYFFTKRSDKTFKIDAEHDILYGIEGDIIELPEYKQNDSATQNKIVLDTSLITETGKVIEVDRVDGVCQHHITWDEIMNLRKQSYQDYLANRYAFIQKYVILDTMNEYICKSCGLYIDVRQYIVDGAYDDNQRFVPFSMPMDTDLEYLPEYEKYHFAIKIMDKNIEKLTASVGLSYFTGSSASIRWRRKGIIKSTIDMVTHNNQILAKKIKERTETKTDLYGISKGLSNLFIFEMENSIFQSSSKDKDQEQYKMIKRNNIIVYILLFLLVELNESQISSFSSDKKNLCDIKIFDSVYKTLFGGLKIRINNTTETVNIAQYKILCYIIYMLSCRIAKHRMWYSQQSTEKNIQKMIPIIQKFIIHTAIDILNSIIENSFEPNANYIFEIYRIRFVTNLRSLYSNNSFYDMLLTQNKVVYAVARRRPELKPVPDELVQNTTFGDVSWLTVVPVRHFLPIRVVKSIDLHNISNLTNCSSGEVHKWKIVGGKVVCQLCNAKLDEISYDEKLSAKIKELSKDIELNLHAQKICQVDGRPHIYTYSSETKTNVCIKCKKSDTHKYSKEELNIIENQLHKNCEQKQQHFVETQLNTNKIDSENSEKIKKNTDELKQHIAKLTLANKYEFIDKFIDFLEKIVGKDIGNLRTNTYIIDHDHNGYDTAGNNIVISDSNKIMYKQNHPFFKTDVIYYTNKTAGRIDVFYDAISKILLGHKEASKDYVMIRDSRKYLKINYSIYNKLKLMGYIGEYIDMNADYADLASKHSDKNGKVDAANLIREIFKERIDNLKKFISEFQKLTNRIIYKSPKLKTNVQPDQASQVNENNITYFSEKVDSLVDIYKQKLNDIKLTYSNQTKIFADWKYVVAGMTVDRSNNIDVDSTFGLYSVDLIDKFDDNGKMMLFYIVTEFTKLLENNTGYTRTHGAHFIVDFINRLFNQFNNHEYNENSDIKRFKMVLKSAKFAEEIPTSETSGIYEEYVDNDAKPTQEELEETTDIKAENEGYDMEDFEETMEEHAESSYDQQDELEPNI